MSKEDIILKIDNKIATLFLNKPEKKNAMSLSMYQLLLDLLSTIERDESIKAVVIRSVNDSVFAAGADISEFIESRSTKEKAKKYNDSALGAIDKLYRLNKPTIAMIQGHAIGGGVELALACDYRLSADDGIFGITPSKLGIVYNLASTKRLIDTIGAPKTKDLLYTGKFINSEQALTMGLVHEVYLKRELEENTYNLARRLVTSSTVAISGTKTVIQAVLDGENEETEELEQLILDSFESDDYKEGIQAFLSKRAPNFK
ncbi:enoyl-CoA hydratase [Aquibacillus halophilus]|uniref:Enoyl-CoA hydratase n=1 Tax=Aquibacillus halophilus TaxID=930132 RepID=A0A6A8DL98_9BACI|nr:enoyl-CoA hydratase-related protein [Aquibacillus halophilus]MRH42032.1 enoyl-CoA hydratase [Aquibacillus halophilus]